MNKNLAVVERKIRPIYDYLDIGNAKRALQEVEKLLKKQPDFLCAKILKALSLIRSGRVAEADDILKTLDDLDTDDEFALQALTYCFRDLGRPDRIVQFYERALKKQPQNEEFLSHVMMAHCRTGQYKLQNQFAMQLYKLKPNKHYYYFWSIMATVMQGYENPEKRQVFLSLAEKMAEKSLKENKMTAEPEVRLYSMILEMLGKHSEAIDLLTSDLNKTLSINKLDLNAKLIEMYVSARRFDDVFGLCEEMLSENLDEWLAWNQLIESGFSIIESNDDLKTNTIDHITHLILSNVEKTSRSEQPCRGPFLARLKFIQRLLAKELIPRSELGTSQLGEPSVLIFEYIKLFGHKPCAFMDLRPYLDLVNDSKLNTFLDSLEKLTTLYSAEDENVLPENIKALRIHICCLNIAWTLGVYDKLIIEKKLNFISYLIKCYLSGLKYGSNLPPNDLQYSDDYLLMAAHFVWGVYLEKHDSNLILAFLSVLEFALVKSQANFKFKLILAKIYAYFGCADCLQESLQRLQIKYIMHETLWYLIFDKFSPFGSYEQLLDWCSSSINFASMSDKEITDNVIQCYKSGSFDRVMEFLAFRQKLRKSLQVRASRVLQRYFTLIFELSFRETFVRMHHYEFDPFKDYDVPWNELVDNRDFKVFEIRPVKSMENWETNGLCKHESSYNEAINELKFYDLIGRIFSLITKDILWTNKSSGSLNHNGENGSPKKNDASKILDILRHLNDLQQQLTAHFLFCNDINANSVSNDIDYLNGLPQRSYFYDVYCVGSYFSVLMKFLTITAEFLHNFHQNGEKVFQFTSAHELQAQIKTMFSNHQLKENEGLFPYAQMAHISFIVQTNSLILIILNLYNSYVFQRVPNSQLHVQTGDQQVKKSKKKKQPCNLNESDNIFSAIITTDWKNSFQEICHMIFQSIDTTKRVVSDLELILETSLIDLALGECKIFSEMNLPSCSEGIDPEMDAKNFNNLITRTKQLMSDCAERADVWKARIKEYDELKQSLEWISSETQHPVMVPFGSCAFMPGKMIHTNEILVLLGDNWFVERSIAQATEIVNRRIEYCNNMLKKIADENKLFAEKIIALSNLNDELLVSDGVEIREYIDDEKSVLSTIAEEKYEGDEDRTTSHISNSTIVKPKRVSDSEYQTLMSHLDDLMREEDEDDEELRSNANSNYDRQVDSSIVRQAVDLQKNDERSSLSEKISSERRNCSGKTVKWKESEEKTPEVLTCEKSSSVKKSILKNSHESSPIDQKLLDNIDIIERGPTILPGSIEAFSGIINEKPANMEKKMSEGDEIHRSTKPNSTMQMLTKEEVAMIIDWIKMDTLPKSKQDADFDLDRNVNEVWKGP